MGSPSDAALEARKSATRCSPPRESPAGKKAEFTLGSAISSANNVSADFNYFCREPYASDGLLSIMGVFGRWGRVEFVSIRGRWRWWPFCRPGVGQGVLSEARGWRGFAWDCFGSSNRSRTGFRGGDRGAGRTLGG